MNDQSPGCAGGICVVVRSARARGGFCAHARGAVFQVSREYGTLLLYYRMNIVYVRPLTLFGPLPNIHAQLLYTLFHDKLIYTFSLIASQMCTGTIFYVYSNSASASVSL